MSRLVIALIAALILSGCRWSARECPSTPVIVEVPVPVREPIPAELTAPLDDSMCVDDVEGPTVGEIRRERKGACAAVEIGNARLQQLRGLRPENPQ